MKPFLRNNQALLALGEELLLGVRRLRALPEEGGRGGRDSVIAGGPFREHRRYVPGDDPRRVDWYGYARTGELNVKLFESDRGHTLPLLVDLTSSVEFGDPPRWRRILELAAVMVYVGLALADRVDLVLARGRGKAERITLRGGGQLAEGWAFLERARPGGRGTSVKALHELLQNRRGGNLWWISDFFPLDQELFIAARERRFRIRGLLPTVPQDHLPLAPEMVLMRGLEGEGEALVQATGRLKKRVATLWEEEMERLRMRFGVTGGSFTLVPREGMAAALVGVLG